MGAVTHNAAAFCTKSINLTIILFMATHQKPQPIIPSLPSYDYQPKLYNGPSLQEVAHLRREYINPVVSTYYQKPIMIVEGSMQYVFDETGKRYLDAFAGIATISVGHCHPSVVKAVQEQSENCSIPAHCIYILPLQNMPRC
ncbi:MAG: aminotransferase class III-fold pyridoxal phosphate-dependent enzyme [Okeania sp. SIO1H6]|uniref:alanine--glyoxylate transaminase n=1 Tax=Okeania hirsuta TaxID=1458930 RepID=A0A3N6P675_9CYAN|nr:aminotransferase class III-fold pyridoxal phosphate-dependent enzyme [Okeania sp. SIO1F9]NES79629.1 aminotransferase class III-fold pyridoxal phosphate-dependent enzyme [Okeania sp. SIO1H4]NES88695.1 aminotransferase class III-fold pyridoxal phosphate-dependent enzyme [Okeania sp. SIO2B9]NET12548.1 aminotransferase class III-fold pyridoxal phosphate-dependent enzyme [Okeania sp. SIO1H6]NET23559.1 aminotransferase class III-fold pyridoxal phosphate-dependent enzyme [Okeania sp. SIO1H5]NET968